MPTMSSLSSKYLPATNYQTGRNGKKICKFTPHYMAGDLSLESCVGCWVNRDASSTYGIDSNGNIACFVYEENRPYTSSSASNDNQAITVEVANLDNVSGKISDKAWQSLVKLATDICHRYNFRLSFDGTPNGSLTMHKMFSATACPGPWLESHMQELAETVNKNLDEGNFNYSGTASSGTGNYTITDPAIAYAAGISGQILFSQEEVYPYIVTIDSKTPKLNWKKLKEQDVIGVCIKAGSYFSASHTINPQFRNPRLEEQYDNAKEANVAIGLLFDIRGRNADEVKNELYEIRLTTLRYPPNMGVWLSPAFTTYNKETNDKLIQLYSDTLYKLGLNDQVGFYCKKEELDKFNWKEMCEKWYWWMDRHLKSVDKIHDMPTPEFFMYEGVKDEEALIEPDFEGWENIQSGVGSGTVSSSLTGSLQTTYYPPAGYGTFASFEKGDMNWAAGTNQRKLFHDNASRLSVDENGFYRISGRYIIAMGNKFGPAGNIVNIYFNNGSVLEAVVGDIKSPGDAGANQWGHSGGKNMIEYIIKSDHVAGNTGATWYGNVGRAQSWLTNEWYNKLGYNSGIKKIDMMGSVF